MQQRKQQRERESVDYSRATRNGHQQQTRRASSQVVRQDRSGVYEITDDNVSIFSRSPRVWVWAPGRVHAVVSPAPAGLILGCSTPVLRVDRHRGCCLHVRACVRASHGIPTPEISDAIKFPSEARLFSESTAEHYGRSMYSRDTPFPRSPMCSPAC